jgi:hypothetical protein
LAKITEEEKLRRRSSTQSALGTFAMEGLAPDNATLAVLRRFEDGELTMEQFSVAMDRHAAALLAAQRTMVGA